MIIHHSSKAKMERPCRSRLPPPPPLLLCVVHRHQHPPLWHCAADQETWLTLEVEEVALALLRRSTSWWAGGAPTHLDWGVIINNIQVGHRPTSQPRRRRHHTLLILRWKARLGERVRLSGQVDEGVDGGDGGGDGGRAGQQGLQEGAWAGEHLGVRHGGRGGRVPLACPTWGLTKFTISSKTLSLQQEWSVQPVDRWEGMVAVDEGRFSSTPFPPSECE